MYYTPAIYVKRRLRGATVDCREKARAANDTKGPLKVPKYIKYWHSYGVPAKPSAKNYSCFQ